jgi:hypothetical protein
MDGDRFSRVDGYDVISDMLGWLKTNDNRCIYRGHSDVSWPITPSAFRPNARGMVAAAQVTRWRNIAGRFANPVPRHEIEWIVLAQHYGIATPLLDWTTNPLTALFFACLDIRSETDGCVIRCDRDMFEQFHKPETVAVFKSGRIQPGLIDAGAMNARTLAQDSVMSIHTEHNAVLPESPALVTRFIIPADNKYRTLHRLKNFGFTAERMFHDLTTAAIEFKESLDTDFVFGIEDMDHSF